MHAMLPDKTEANFRKHFYLIPFTGLQLVLGTGFHETKF